MVYRYDEEEWDNIIAKDPEWSRDETDYLLDLCDTFKLRFVPIADRYEVSLPFGCALLPTIQQCTACMSLTCLN